jgi:endonuclease YncB( thermonuclease family)
MRLTLVLIAAVFAMLTATTAAQASTKTARWHRFDDSRWRITDVVDGDTIKVRKLGGPAPRTNWTVRLIGIDAPSVRECGGVEARAALLQRSFTAPDDTDGDGLVDERGGTGRHVRLRTDLSQDLYDAGDLLAYATTSVGTDLALSQIKRGWSDFFIDADEFDRYDRYVEAAERALDRSRGAWDTCGGDFDLPLG